MPRKAILLKTEVFGQKTTKKLYFMRSINIRMNLIYLRGGRKRCHYRHKNWWQCTIIHYSVFFSRTTLAGFQHDFIMTLILSFRAPFLKPYAIENIVNYFFLFYLSRHAWCDLFYVITCTYFFECYFIVILVFGFNSPETFRGKGQLFFSGLLKSVKIRL